MDFATSLGIGIVILSAWIGYAMIREALKSHDKRKAQERQEKMNRHPILYNIVGALIAWKAMEIWNRSRSEHPSRPSRDAERAGRSVYEDLNLD